MAKAFCSYQDRTMDRGRSLTPDQKAIIASGFSETWRVKEALRLGAGAHGKNHTPLIKSVRRSSLN